MKSIFIVNVSSNQTSTLGHPVDTADRRVPVAQRSFSTKLAAPADHLAIQNADHTSFLFQALGILIIENRSSGYTNRLAKTKIKNKIS